MFEQLNFSQNPVAYVTLAVMLLLLGHDMIAGGKTLPEVVTTEYLEYLAVTAGGVVAYFNVFAPNTVRRMDEHEVE